MTKIVGLEAGTSSEVLPALLVKAISALDNKTRREIIYAVDASKTMPFTSIYKEIGVSKQDLAVHVKILVNAGLLYQKVREQEGDRFSSYYCLTQFAVDLLRCLIISQDTSRCKEL